MFDGKLYIDDIEELYIKLRQRGAKFLFSKVNTDAQSRTTSAFDLAFEHANWWIIPALKKRFNSKITGNPDITYEQYICEQYFAQKKVLIISPGCGSGSHEIAFASFNSNLKIRGYDIAKPLIAYANRQAKARNLVHQCEFLADDITKVHFPPLSVDCFLFHSSLHHFYNIEALLIENILPALKADGIIIIHEYVGANRLQVTTNQIAICNTILNTIIPKAQRKILGTHMTKTHCYRQGLWRMIISDPSECVDAESILPTLRKHMREEEYVPLGGNIAMPVLKHIAHHFVNENQDILQQIFHLEDQYLQEHLSDYAFGVYRKIN
jgi:SAM-dependent methyltransferase